MGKSQNHTVRVIICGKLEGAIYSEAGDEQHETTDRPVWGFGSGPEHIHIENGSGRGVPSPVR